MSTAAHELFATPPAFCDGILHFAADGVSQGVLGDLPFIDTANTEIHTTGITTHIITEAIPNRECLFLIARGSA